MYKTNMKALLILAYAGQLHTIYTYSVEKLYAHDTLLQIIRSVCLCVQYNCSGNHCRKVGCDLEGNARVVDAGHTYSMFPFFTVPFVAQWYYNGQSVPFRLYVLFHSVCSSALPVTLELETVARAVASSAKMTSKKPASA